MASEAHFTRSNTAEGAVFDITPARGHPTALVLIFGLYGLAVFLKLLSPWSKWWLLVLLAAGVLHFFHWKEFRRAPVTLLVSKEGIRAGASFYSIDDVRGLYVARPGSSGGWEPLPDSEILLGAQERSYALMVRLSSSSKLIPLARGLTMRTGKMLLGDISEILDLKKPRL